MKMVLVVADAARVELHRQTLMDSGAPGYTEMPVVEGAGRSGIRAGDRVHPGGLVVLFAIVEDGAASPLFEALVRERDAAHDRVTRFFILPVERQG